MTSRGAANFPVLSGTSAPDAEGHGLIVTVRISPDGLVYFHDLTPDMLPLAQVIAPDDESLRSRVRAAEAFRRLSP